jgi:hypothetical protein
MLRAEMAAQPAANSHDIAPADSGLASLDSERTALMSPAILIMVAVVEIRGVEMSVNCSKFWLIFVVIASMFALSLVSVSCNQGGESDDSSGVSTGAAKSPGAITDKDAIAIVNGKAISRAKFDARVEGELAMYKSGGMEATDEIKRDAKRSVFARMASDEMAFQKAQELGVAISSEAAKADVDKVVERMGGEDAVLAFLGNMGGTIKTIDEFVEWKRIELSRDALIEKIGEKVTVDKDALKKQFDELMAEYEKNRNEGKPAVMPGGSVEEFIERMTFQAKLVEFDKYMDGALSTAKVELFDPDLEGAIQEFIDSEGAMGGGSPHGDMPGMGNPHGGMPNPHGGESGDGSSSDSGGAGGEAGSGEGAGTQKDPLATHGT